MAAALSTRRSTRGNVFIDGDNRAASSPLRPFALLLPPHRALTVRPLAFVREAYSRRRRLPRPRCYQLLERSAAKPQMELSARGVSRGPAGLLHGPLPSFAFGCGFSELKPGPDRLRTVGITFSIA